MSNIESETPIPVPGPLPLPAELLKDDPDHPGFILSGVDDTPGQKAYYIHLEAKSGKGEKVQAFLSDILAGVKQEPLTGPWFAVRYSDTTFGVFEAFPDANARHAHDNGPGGQNFLRVDDLHDMLAYPARVYRLDVLFGKFNVMFGKQAFEA
jgi:quinol monooxygenase YgiN